MARRKAATRSLQEVQGALAVAKLKGTPPVTAARREHQTAMQKRDTHVALEAALSRPTLYEMQNRGSGHGLPIRMRDGTTFWSKGWKMCSQGCRVPLDNWQLKLHYVEEQKAGVVIKRFTCTAKKTHTGGRSGLK